ARIMTASRGARGFSISSPVSRSAPFTIRLDTRRNFNYSAPSLARYPTWDHGDLAMKIRASSRAWLLAGVMAGWLSAAVAVAQLLPATSGGGRLIVKEVIVQGNHAVPTPKIMAKLHTRADHELNQDTINEDIRKLYETKQFGNIQVKTDYTSDGKVNVYF